MPPDRRNQWPGAFSRALISLLFVLVVQSAAPAQVRRLTFPYGQIHLAVEVLEDGLVHCELSSSGAPPPAGAPLFHTPMVQNQDFSGPALFVDHGGGMLETRDLRIIVDPASPCLAFYDKTRQPDLVLTRLCLDASEPAFPRLTIEPAGFTHAYGLGQQFLAPGDANGQWIGRRRTPGCDFGNAIVGWNGGMIDNNQFPVVYFLGPGTANYALLLDNPYAQTWDFTGTPWSVRTGGQAVRFYVMAGPDLPGLRRDYLELTGRPPVPPRRMFGLWVSEYGYDDWQEPEAKLATLRANRFPLDGFVLDLPWYGGILAGSDNTRMGSLSWDPVHFPDPAGRLATWREVHGIGALTVEEPYVGRNLPEHTELAARGYLARQTENGAPVYLSSNPWWGTGGMIDWTNPDAGRFWHDGKREALIAAGVTGHWTDLGEPEVYDSAAWYSGVEDGQTRRHAQADVHNLYNLLWSRSIFEGYARNGHQQRPFILSRSGAPGSQRFGVAMWSADISSRPSSLATHCNAQLHMSMSGIDYFGSDVGGLHRSALDGNLDELYTQWFAVSAALDVPVRPHTLNLCNCQETAPDRVGDLPSNRANLQLRYSLSPYLYSLAHRAWRFGEPVFPPPVFYFQADPELRDMGHEKLIGRDLLVAIVAAYGETERRVYLPAGEWADYHSGERFSSPGAWFGPFSVYPDGLFRLPLFARAGAILPLMPVDDQTMNMLGQRLDGSRRDELVVRVFAAPTESSFTLFEDDGETIAYQRGEVRETLLGQAVAPLGGRVSIASASGSYAGAPVSRDHRLEWVSDEAPAVVRVCLDGRPLPRVGTEAGLAAGPGWRLDGARQVTVRTGELVVGASKTITLEFLAGDVNGDARLTVQDLLSVQLVLLGMIPLGTGSAAHPERGDLNGNGVLDSADLVLLAERLAAVSD